MSEQVERRFCWPCLLLALLPVLGLLALGWWAVQNYQASIAAAQDERSALIEENLDLDDRNQQLMAELAKAQTDLEDARVAGIGPNDWSLEVLSARASSLEAEPRAQLLTSLNITPADIRTSFAGLSGADKSQLFTSLTQDSTEFANWFENLSDDARGAWLEALPNYKAPADPEASAQLAEKEQAYEERVSALQAQLDEMTADLEEKESAPILDRLGALLAATPEADQDAFFASLPEQEPFKRWFASQSLEAKEAFINALPDAPKLQVELPDLGALSAPEVQTAFADLTGEKQNLTAERDTLAAEVQKLMSGAAKIELPRLGEIAVSDAPQEFEKLYAALDKANSDLEVSQAEVAAAGQDAQTATSNLADQLRDSRDQTRRLQADLAEANDANIAARARIDALKGEVEKAKFAASEAEVAAREALSNRLRGSITGASDDDAPINPVEDRITLSSNLAFEVGSTALSASGRKALDELAKELLSDIEARPDSPWTLAVEGHTDARPISTDRYPSNWELSAVRAASVARYLASKGVPEERLIVVGRGEFDPHQDGDDESAYAANRRIEFNLQPD